MKCQALEILSLLGTRGVTLLNLHLHQCPICFLKSAGISFFVPQGHHTRQTKPDLIFFQFLYYLFHWYLGVLPIPIKLWKVLFDVIKVPFFSSSEGPGAVAVKVGACPG